jgi:hypothetical protein
MESHEFSYLTEGLNEFIYGIHLNNLEASSSILIKLAEIIEESSCKKIGFKHLPTAAISRFRPGQCEISVKVFDMSLTDLITVVLTEIKKQEDYLMYEKGLICEFELEIFKDNPNVPLFV